jgi:hypothetical protein
MRADLRRMYSPDVDDLRRWDPDADEPAILVQLMVGPDGAEGEESFEVTLCTSEWLRDRAQKDGIVDGRHHYVVAEYDYDRVLSYFRRRVSSCEGDAWPDVAAHVAQIGAWEFEDYTP